MVLIYNKIMGEITINNINLIIIEDRNPFPNNEEFFGIDYDIFFNFEYIIGELSGVYIII